MSDPLVPSIREWQCPCGAWVSMDSTKHVHVTLRQPTLDEMIAARNAGHDETALNATVDTTEQVVWRPEYPRRNKPDERR